MNLIKRMPIYAGSIALCVAMLLIPSVTRAADATAGCSIDPAPILEKGESFGINVSFSNNSAYPVTFTVTTKKSIFFGNDDTVAVRKVGSNLGIMQYLSVSTINVLQTGRGPLVIEVTSSVTGDTILARCSADLIVYSPTEIAVPLAGASVSVDGVCDAGEYAAAGVVGIRSPQYVGAVVRTQHSASDLFICISSLKSAVSNLQGRNRVHLYISRAGLGGIRPGFDDLAFDISPDGKVQAHRGGEGGFDGPDPGGYEAKVSTQASNNTWSAELRISRATLGDGWWNRDLGFTVQETTINDAADVYGWPTAAQASKPATWGVAHLVDTPLSWIADLRVAHIEVNQTVQSLSNEVILIAGKRTFARVHVATNVYADMATEQGARLHGFRADGTELGSPLMPINVNRVFLDPKADRGAIDGGYLFELPASWVTPGNISLKAEVNPLRVVGESNYANNTLTIGPLVFQETHPLTIELIPYTYKWSGKRYDVPEEWMDQTESLLRRELPLSNLVVQRDPVVFNAADDAYSMYVAQEYVRDLLVKEGRYKPNVYYYAVMSTSGGVSRGGISNVAAGNPGQTAIHEMGHMFGLDHVQTSSANCNQPDPPYEPYPYPDGIIGGPAGDTSRYYGFDPGDASLSYNKLPNVRANSYHDNLTYCSDTWQSDYSYVKIRNFIQTINAGGGAGGGSASTFLRPQMTAAKPTLLVRAVIVPNGQVIGLRTQLNRLPLVGTPIQSSSTFLLRLFDGRNQQVAQYPMRVDPYSDARGHAALSASVPIPARVRRLAIGTVGSKAELASQAVSVAAPRVKVSSLPGGPNFQGTATIALRWSGLDSDGDRLHYDVLYSNDGDANWRTLAMGLSDSNYDVDASRLGGTRSALAGRLRVIASDGINTATGDSAAFSLAGKPPGVAIVSPNEGRGYSYGQIVTLEGRAIDLQDAAIADERMVWSSDRDGQIGAGRLLTPSLLSAGTHRITLTATNSLGLSASQSVTVSIAAYNNSDQRNEAAWVGGAVNLLPVNTVRQSFVPADPCLTGVDVALAGNHGQGGGDVTLRVKDENLHELGTATLLLAEGFEGYAHFDTSTHGGVALLPGRRYLLELSGPPNNAYFWRYAAGNPYARGQAFFAGSAFADNDFLFRTFGSKGWCSKVSN